jgi:choline-sulfatase
MKGKSIAPFLAIIFLCGGWGRAQQTKAPVRARPTKPNVLLITIDTLRADRLGCYGYKDIQTPVIDALARDSIVFDRAIAQVPLTWPSHAAILTGTYPFQNGVQDFTGQPLEPRFRSIAQAFKEQGYSTGAVVSAFVLDRSWGLARGFDFYDDAFSAETFAKKDIGLVDRRATESVAHAVSWLKKQSGHPFFFWLHLYDPHSPYDPPEPYKSEYRTHPYDGEIAYADHALGSLITWLKQNRLYGSTVIALLSDHGESLGEHGESEHGFFIYNSTVQIPLLLKPRAGSGFRAARVSTPVETTALAPTLLQLGKLTDAIEKQFSSPSLLRREPSAKSTAYSETSYPFSSFGWSPLGALQTDQYHYIEAPNPELYDLSSDPQEKANLASQRKASVAIFKDELQKLQSNHPFQPVGTTASNLQPDAVEKLRSLGYVAYRSPAFKEAPAAGLPDPKSKLWEFNSILKAADAFQAGDFEAGKTLLENVRSQDAKMHIVPFMLGETALRRRNWTEAAAELQKCLELNPGFDQAMVGLARALAGLDKPNEAMPWIEKALKFNPQNYRAWYERGSIASKTDRTAAIADMEKAISIQPNFAPVRRDLGMLQFEQKNYGEAAKQLAKAAELGIDDAPLYNFLGISYSRTGRLREAAGSYKQALKIDPKLAEAHLNLGFASQRLGQEETARQEYSEACRLEKKFCEFAPR